MPCQNLGPIILIIFYLLNAFHIGIATFSEHIEFASAFSFLVQYYLIVPKNVQSFFSKTNLHASNASLIKCSVHNTVLPFLFFHIVQKVFFRLIINL